MAKVIILSGAGISAESGISTFREVVFKILCQYQIIPKILGSVQYSVSASDKS